MKKIRELASTTPIIANTLVAPGKLFFASQRLTARPAPAQAPPRSPPIGRRPTGNRISTSSHQVRPRKSSKKLLLGGAGGGATGGPGGICCATSDRDPLERLGVFVAGLLPHLTVPFAHELLEVPRVPWLGHLALVLFQGRDLLVERRADVDQVVA